MKITLCFLIFLAVYFFSTVEAQNFKRNVTTRVPQVTRRQNPRRVLVTRRNDLRAQRIRRARKIVCVYGATGRWPRYPASLQRLVTIQSRRILGKSREEILKFCRQLNLSRNRTNQVFTTRRSASTSRFPQNFSTFTTPRFVFTLPPFTTPRFYTTPSSTFNPTVTPSTKTQTVTPSTTTQTPPTSTRAFAVFPVFTVAQPLTILTTPSTTVSSTINPLFDRSLTTVSTTTTTVKAPSASGSGSSYYYSGSGSAYYSGSGSAYYTATGSLTAKASDPSSRLIRPANELTRSFKAKNGDIIIKWAPGGGKLKKIGV